MKHQQVLDKLAAKSLAQAIDLDLGILIREKWNNNLVVAEIKEEFFSRWNCALNASIEEVSDLYKDKVILIIGVLFHKYGLKDKGIMNAAIVAIDSLNKSVALSDTFYHQTDTIKKLLLSEPFPLKKRLSIVDAITFYRAQDVISIQFDNKYYVAYIHETNGNESPIIEFYDVVFDERPVSIDQLRNVEARGNIYNDGTRRISKYSIFGMKDLPDLAYQIHLIKASVDVSPENTNLGESIGLYTVGNIFQLRYWVKELFEK